MQAAGCHLISFPLGVWCMRVWRQAAAACPPVRPRELMQLGLLVVKSAPDRLSMKRGVMASSERTKDQRDLGSLVTPFETS